MNASALDRRSFFSQAMARATRQLQASGLTKMAVKGQVSNTKALAGDLPAPDFESLLLSRISFGISPNLRAELDELGVAHFLESQLNWELRDQTWLDEEVDILAPLTTWSLGELFDANEETRNDVIGQMVLATWYRQFYSRNQLHEVMVEFWSNHFNVNILDGPVRFFKVIEDRKVMRPLALRSFPQLLRADAMSAAMMFYLDNYSNVKDGPNENYARELLELHTLGVDGGYSEDDVKAVARCFTGWSIGENSDDGFQFYPQFHDFSPKQFLGHTIYNPDDGMADGLQVLDILASSPVTAGFIATKLVRRFYGDSGHDLLIRRVAKTYLDTQGDIKAMLRTLLLSEEFAQSANLKFKRPVEFAFSLLHQLQAVQNASTLEEKVAPLFVMFRHLDLSGHIPFFWSPPTGYPDVAGYWLNPGSLLHRWNLALAVSQGDEPLDFLNQGARRNRLEGVMSDYIRYPLDALLQGADSASDQVEALRQAILQRPILATDRQVFENFLASGVGTLEQRLRGVVGLMLCSDYFQLR